jgi:hypothetical protein
MFSWECPKCGRDNPPSAARCLSCGTSETEDLETAAATLPQAMPASAPVAAPPLAPEPIVMPPASTRVAAEPQLPPRYNAPPPAEKLRHAAGPGMPTWLLGLLFAMGFLAIGFSVYYGIQYFGNRTSTAAKNAINTGVARTNKVSNPLQKYIEVIGIRLYQDPSKKMQARFVVVNHSSTELSDLSANVTLWASTAKSEEEPAGTFAFQLGRLGPNESKELTEPLKTKLKIYEMPDWQNINADLQISAQ